MRFQDVSETFCQTLTTKPEKNARIPWMFGKIKLHCVFSPPLLPTSSLTSSAFTFLFISKLLYFVLLLLLVFLVFLLLLLLSFPQEHDQVFLHSQSAAGRPVCVWRAVRGGKIKILSGLCKSLIKMINKATEEGKAHTSSVVKDRLDRTVTLNHDVIPPSLMTVV